MCTPAQPLRTDPVWNDFAIRWILELGLCGYRPPAESRHPLPQHDPARVKDKLRHGVATKS